VIDAALAILSRRLREPGAVVTSPGAARELLRLHLGQCERERFGVLFLDSRHAVIGFEVLFEGTLAQTAVYPREVVRRALQLNAGAVILAHNHPSGAAAPSRADEVLTQTLKASLQLVDVRVIDHLVIGWPGVCSMAEAGLMEPAAEYAWEPPAPWAATGDILSAQPVLNTLERSPHV
jgi:DNA repair protein RadC